MKYRILFSALSLFLFPRMASSQSCPPSPDPLSDLHWTGIQAGGGGLLPNGPSLSTMRSNGDIYVAGNVGLGVKVARWDGSRWKFLGDRLYHASGSTATAFGIGVADNGDVYVGGVFTNADNGNGTPPVFTPNIARWNATTNEWGTLGGGFSQPVYALAVDNNANLLYLSVLSEVPMFINIGRWNITLGQWETMGILDGPVQKFAIGAGSDMYAIGQFTNAFNPGGGAPIVVNRIARWDGAQWYPLAGGLRTDAFFAAGGLGFSNNSLYAYGNDMQAVNADSSRMQGPVVSWSGTTWSSMPLGGIAMTSPTFGPTLVVDATNRPYVLSFDSSYVQRYVSRWDTTQWTRIARMTGSDYAFTLAANSAVGGARLYMGGNFAQVLTGDSSFAYPVGNNALWVGISWQGLVGPAGSNGVVNVLEIDDGIPSRLYVGGTFGQIAGQSARNIAVFDGVNWTSGFGPGGPVHAVSAPSSAGPTVFGGEFTTWITEAGDTLQARNIFIPISGPGSQPGVDGPVYALLNKYYFLGSGGASGSVIVGGAFTICYNPDGSTLAANSLARWDFETERWEQIGNGLAGSTPVVRAITDGSYGYAPTDPDFYVAGSFSGAVNTDNTVVNSPNIIYWKTVTIPQSRWEAVGRGVNGLVRTLATHAIGNFPEALLIWAGGEFDSSINSNATAISTPHISLWSVETGQWVPLAGGVDSAVYSIRPDALNSSATNGAFIGGRFTRGLYPNGNARTMNRFGFASPFDPQTWFPRGTNNTNDLIRSLAVARFCFGGGDNVYAGGDFSIAGVRIAEHLAHWRRKGGPCTVISSASSSTHTTGGGGGSGAVSIGVASYYCSPLGFSPLGGYILADSLDFLESVFVDSVNLGQYITVTIRLAGGATLATVDSVLIDGDRAVGLFVLGVYDTSQFAPNPDGRSTALTLMTRDVDTEALQPGNVQMVFVHAVTDGPTIDLVIQGGATVVDSLPYGAISEEVSLAPATYTFNVVRQSDGQVLRTFTRDLGGFADRLVTVMLSGFMDPALNHNGPPVSLDVVSDIIVVGVKRRPDRNLPHPFSLSQNYPNPFNPTTRIKYQIPNDNYVTLKVFDILGREVRTLVNETQIAGEHEVTFDAYGLARQTAGGLASGIYFYRITAGEFRQTKKLILLR